MQQHKRFKWRAGNAVELIVDGEQFFPVMLKAIRDARHSVLMEFYLVSSGHIMERFIVEMIAAAKRGVMVRLIIDGFGGRKLSDRDRRRLEAEGILILVYNPVTLNKLTRNFARDHRKLMIIDQQRAGHTFTIWPEQDPARPFGVNSYYTRAGLRSITVRRLD